MNWFILTLVLAICGCQTKVNIPCPSTKVVFQDEMHTYHCAGKFLHKGEHYAPGFDNQQGYRGYVTW